MSRMKDNLKVGTPDVEMDAPSHIDGVAQGNAPGGIEQDPGFYPSGSYGAARRPGAKSTARRSTGINPEARNPIDPNSPSLSPA